MIKQSFFSAIVILGSVSFALAQNQPAAGKQNEKQVEESSRYESFKKRSVEEDAADLLQQARLIKHEQPKEALNIVEQALGLSLAQHDEDTEASCYVLLGEINEGIQEWKLAAENYFVAYQKLMTKRPKKLRSKFADNDLDVVLAGLGRTNLELQNYERALQYFQEALQRAQTVDKPDHLLKISQVYFEMEQYENSLDALKKIDIPKTDDGTLTAQIQNQQAKIYAATNESEKAIDAYQSSQNSLRSSPSRAASKNQDVQLDAKEEVAEILHDQARYDDEILLRNQSIEYNLESNNLPEVTKDKVGLGRALAAKGETKAAIKELEEAAMIADTINDPREQAKAFLALANLYERKNRNVEALATYKRYSEAVERSEKQNVIRLTEKSELIKKQKDIEELAKDVEIGKREDTIAQATVEQQRLIIYGLILIICIIAVTSYFIYRAAQASKVANQLLALKSLRSQMNPHFIFNALNSVNHFIAQNDERTANKFLSEFSRLMRLVLENSQHDFIPLITEQEIISLYLKLEHYRFRDRFDYQIKIEDGINLELVEIPPMLVQPYIENAVWHGLRYKESRGFLSFNIGKNNNGLKIEIVDDGIGRKKSIALKTENQKKQVSTGLKNIQERLKIINKVYKMNYNIEVRDLDEVNSAGTKVTIHLPYKKLA